MNTRLLMVCHVLLLVVVMAAPARSAETDEAGQRKLLAGDWRGFAVEGKGENPDAGAVKLELTITDKTIHGVTFQGGQRVDQGEGKYALDLAAAPAALDGSKLRLNGRQETWLGIYTLEGDTLKWCVGRRERPTEFETVKGQFLLILRRAKPAP
ncbi:MAG: TIGR03067 domain-containing protein [Pirellulaceae bacterium]